MKTLMYCPEDSFAIKSTEDGEVNYKAWFIIGCHRDRLKRKGCKISSTLQPEFISTLFTIAYAKEFDV